MDSEQHTMREPEDVSMTQPAQPEPQTHGAEQEQTQEEAPGFEQAQTDTDGHKEALGRSVLPIAKVKRILKVDPGYIPCTEVAVFMVAKSTEFFVKQLTMAAHMNSKIEKRKTVQYKDVSKGVSNTENLVFLKQIVPPVVSVRRLIEKDQIKYSKGVTSIKNIKKLKQESTDVEPKKKPRVQPKNKLLKGQQVLPMGLDTTVTPAEATEMEQEILKQLADSDIEMSETEVAAGDIVMPENAQNVQNTPNVHNMHSGA